MNEEVAFCLENAKEQMQKAIGHFEETLLKIRAGKASTQMLDGIFVEYYGTQSPLKNISNINTPDPRTITVQPFEKSFIAVIEKAIMAANIGFNPQSDSDLIRINVPPLTEERRKDLVKQAKAEAENCKVSIRNSRREANEYLKQMVKDGLSEDLGKDAEDDVQKLTNAFIAKTDEHLEIKEKEIMTV